MRLELCYKHFLCTLFLVVFELQTSRKQNDCLLKIQANNQTYLVFQL